MTALRTLAPVAVALAALAPIAHAQDADVAPLFPRLAPIEAPSQTGICQLPLTEEVLRDTRPDLSDLRVVEADGREVATLLDRAAVRWPTGGPPASMTLTPTAVERSTDDDRLREELTFQLPDAELPEGAAWTLSLESEVPEFVRATTLTTPEGSTLAEGSVFRLSSPVRQRLDVALPDPAPGKVYVLRLEGEGTEDLGPVLRLVAGPMADRGTVLTLPLEIVSQVEKDGSTVVELARPSGIVPSQLLFATDTPFFSRDVRVFDRREGRDPEAVGSGTIFRAERAGAEGLSVSLSRARGDTIRVELKNGDSPPLESLAVTAVTQRPALFFACRDGQTLLFGGGRAAAPSYDTQRFAGTTIGERIARGNVPQATLGPSAPNPAFDDGPALGALLRPGQPVDRGQFRSVAPLVVNGAREGVSRLLADAGLLARSEHALADLRVVDGEGRQWPYVRAPGPQEIVVPLDVEREELEDGRSRYVLSYAGGELALARVRLQTEAGFVQRDYTARLVDASEPMVPDFGEGTTGALHRDPGAAAPIEVPLALGRGSVELVVENGNDAPLELEAEGVTFAPALYLLAPDGRYEVLIGADVPRAEYEVSHVLGLVLATEVVDAELGATTDNPAWRPPPVAPRFTTAQIAVWSVLLLAVLVLGVLTFRATREGVAVSAESSGSEGASDGASDGPPEEAAEDASEKPPEANPSADEPES